MRIDLVSKAVRIAHGAEPKLNQLRHAAKGVEAMFVKSLMAEMQKGTKLFGEGQGASIYADLFNEALAKQVADRGAFGIADLMVRQGTPKILAETAAEQANTTSTNPTTHP